MSLLYIPQDLERYLNRLVLSLIVKLIRPPGIRRLDSGTYAGLGVAKERMMNILYKKVDSITVFYYY